MPRAKLAPVGKRCEDLSDGENQVCDGNKAPGKACSTALHARVMPAPWTGLETASAPGEAHVPSL